MNNINNNNNIPIIDGHVDLIYEMQRHYYDKPFHEISGGPVTLKKLCKGNVKIIVSAFFLADGFNGAELSVNYLKNLINASDKYLTSLTQIKSREDLDKCFKKGSGVIFLLENADALLNFSISELKNKNIKTIGLTHVGKNRIGDGNMVPFPEKLTKHGKELVKILDQNGFAIDLAHLSEPSFFDVVNSFKGPIMSSHTGLTPFYNTPRNLSPEQIKIILQRKGVIGISVNPEMLSYSQSATINDVFIQIDYIAQKYDVDGIAIGSDFCGFDLINSGLDDISKLSNLAEILDKNGYPEKAVKKILGENWFNFYASLF